jgi:hypothetical protein
MPGVAGPADDFVNRLRRAIERFAADREIEKAYVEVELRDGSRFALEAVSPEPGYGFVTLTPQTDDDLPEEIVVQIGAIARIDLFRAEEERAHLGFMASPPAAAKPKPRRRSER